MKKRMTGLTLAGAVAAAGMTTVSPVAASATEACEGFKTSQNLRFIDLNDNGVVDDGDDWRYDVTVTNNSGRTFEASPTGILAGEGNFVVSADYDGDRNPSFWSEWGSGEPRHYSGQFSVWETLLPEGPNAVLHLDVSMMGGVPLREVGDTGYRCAPEIPSFSKPVTVDEPKPEPAPEKPEPKPEPAPEKPEPKPEPAPEKPEPKPEPAPEKPEPKPENPVVDTGYAADDHTGAAGLAGAGLLLAGAAAVGATRLRRQG